jgi:hypothetical protein
MPQLPETPILFHLTPKEKDRDQENMRNEYGELLGT